MRPEALYGILRLRSEVFVVEQDCVFLDADGRDAADTALHLWIEDAGQVVACGRLLREPGSILGRVVTAPSHRSRGLAARLIREALAVAPRPVRIDAQSQLVRWYAGFGFKTIGDEFLDDGIAHVPMELR